MKNKINYKLLFLMTGLISACSTTIDDGMFNEHEVVENSATVTAPANEEDQNTISILSLPKEQQERVGSYSDYEAIKPKDASMVTLTEVAQLVVGYHPKVAQSLADARGQEDLIDVAKAGYYPQISAGMNMGYDQNTSGAGSTNSRAVSVEIRQTLYDFGKTAKQVKSAELGFEGSKTRSTITKEELVHTSTTTLIEAARQKTMYELSTQHVAQMSSLVQLVKERHAGGATNLSDVLHAESRLNDEKAAQLDTAAFYENHLQRLRILTGKNSIDGVVLNELPTVFATSCSRPIVWEEVPEYILADLESKLAETELDLATAEQLPTIYLQGQASRYLNHPERYRSRNDTSVSVNLSVPVYQGGGLSARKRAYAEYALSASLRKEQVRLEVEEFLSDASISLRNMLSRQDLLEERVKNLGGTRTLYKMQYLDLGSRSLVDLLNSEQEYHNARLAAASNELDAILMQLNCAYYHGKLGEYFNVHTTYVDNHH
ncbi:outer membrane channel protein [Oligella ureolytica]|nr:outer membrane channel protein [Oligella ureolytica]